MSFQETVFSQLVKMVDHHEFERCVKRYQGDYRTRSFSCWDQFLCMLFAQWGEKRSLRATCFALDRMSYKLYHMGIRGKVSTSALSDANNVRNWRIYHDFAQSLIPKALDFYKNDTLDSDVVQTVYAFDSTTIDLCLSVFEWAAFRKTKAGIKLHTLLNLRGPIPVLIWITEAKVNDVHGMDQIVWEMGAIYLFDRGYLDFERLAKIDAAGAFFVTRTKRNTSLKRQESEPKEDKEQGVRSDQIVKLGTKKVLRLTQNTYAA